MRTLLSIATVLMILSSWAWPQSAHAQDVQADAPQYAVDDWDVRLSDGVELLQTATVVDAAGMRVEEAITGYVYHYDPQLNLYKIETGYRTYYFEPSKMRYAFPLHVGKHWEGVVSVRSERPDGTIATSYDMTYECEVACIEHVSVPAGEFDAFKTSCEHIDLDDNDRRRETFWFAPTAGMSVKYVRYKLDANDGWVQTDEMTLLRYRRAEQIEFDILPDGIDSTCNAAISMNAWSVPAQD